MNYFGTAALCAALIVPCTLTTAALAQQKTVKACADEWRANKAANQAAKITEKDFVAKCRAGTAALPAADAKPAAAPAKPATAPAKPMAPAATAPKPAEASPSPTAKRASPPGAAPMAANEFSSEAQAKARCPSDTVVWVNLSSKIYHFAGHKDYGSTKKGAYMCEKDTAGAGARAAKNEKLRN